MERGQFIDEVFKFFKSSDESLKRTYDLAFTSKKRIDWDKLYEKVIKEAEKRYLPAPSWFIGKFDECIITEPGTYKINGGTGVLKLAIIDKSTGEIVKRPTYKYDMCNCPYSLPEIKAKFKAMYKNTFVDFVYYPPYMKVLGNTVIDMREKENVC